MTIGKFTNKAAATLTTGAGTYDFVAGQELDILINGDNAVAASATYNPVYGGDLIRLVFAASMAVSLAAMTATELAAALNVAFIAQAPAGQPAAASAAVVSTDVVITTTRLGKDASLQVLFDSTASVLTAVGFTSGQIANGTGPNAAAQGPVFLDTLKFTGDTSYSTGGTLGFGAAVQAFFGDSRTVIAVVSQDCAGYYAVYLPATDALKVYVTGTASTDAANEVANATNLSSFTFNVLAISN
jgi:hypothetical protein